MRPSNKAIIRVERLEEICVLSLVTYSNYAITVIDPGSGTSVNTTVTFSWDFTDTDYQNFWNQLPSVVQVNSDCALAVDAAYSSIGSDGLASDSLTIAAENYIDSEYNANNQFFGVMDDIHSWARGWMGGFYSSPATMDPSVVSNATAQARVKVLLGQAKTLADRNNQMVQDINNAGSTLDQIAKAYSYKTETQANTEALKSISGELKLIKQAYPGAFK